MNIEPKKPRKYRRITKRTVAEFQALQVTEGNGSAAVRVIDPESKDPGRKAVLIAQKSRELDAGQYIDNVMQLIGIEAVERVRELVRSADERIATKNSHFIIDHVRGKALQRSESKHLNLNIQSVLE